MHILLAILILGFLILLHEFGHYIFCRIFGVKVLRFSIGFGPAILKRKWGDTEFRISLIPWGGYVTPLEGEKIKEIISEVREDIKREKEENRKNMTDDERKIDEAIDEIALWAVVKKKFGVTPEDIEKRSLDSKPYFQKFMIVFAGPLFNFLLGVAIMYILLVTGIPKLTNRVGDVMKNSPAQKAGIKPGDRIIEINGKKIKTWDEIKREVVLSEGVLKIKVEREGEGVLSFEIVPEVREGQRLIGIYPDTAEKTIIKYSPVSAVPMSFAETFRVIGIFFRSIGILFSKEGLKHIGGPVTITKMTADAARQGIISLLLITFMITINLAILNLLPIPVLDGGHILIFTIEALMRRKLSAGVRQAITLAGLFIIFSLIALALHNDIKNVLLTNNEK